MRISTGNFDSIFFLGVTPFLNFEIWRKWKILLKQFVSTTRLKPLNRIAWNFVIMKDIICRYAFLQKMLIWSFWGAIYIPFFVRLPVTCHSLYTAFSSNVGAWGMWACSLFLSLVFWSLVTITCTTLYFCRKNIAYALEERLVNFHRKVRIKTSAIMVVTSLDGLNMMMCMEWNAEDKILTTSLNIKQVC